MVFENELFSPDFGQRVGISTGACTLSSATTWTCIVTLLFNLGQIMLEGKYFEDVESSVLAITGGTDFFLGATGAAMVIFPRGDGNIPIFEFRINLILTDFNAMTR
uniref:Dirigent protein n=1 Tax=Proboscia inermis TaxID=420281 RepID=A0A7S0GH68_9STRA